MDIGLTVAPAVVDWRPIVGCSPISPGCANCAGMKAASAAGLTVERASGPVWSGETRLIADRLNEPDRLSRPSFIYVCVNGDLFHEGNPEAWLDAVFEVIVRNRRHCWSILTKRSARMADYLGRRFPSGVPANIQIGVSAERQTEADVRLADLLALKAATRFVFFYPLLGPVDASAAFQSGSLAYVLAGDEAARPADPAWFSSLSADARAAGLPFEINSQIMVN